jgi:hypothetical protein
VVSLLPPNDAGLRRYGYILRQSVEVITDKSIVSRPDSLLRPPGADAPAPLAADWNDRYRNAAGRKRAGEAKKWSGRGIVGGGGALIALMTLKVLDQGADRNCTDADPCYEYAWGLGAGVGMMVAGGILSSRGSRQIAAANLDLIKLETERLNARPKTAARFRIRLGGAAGWETSVAIAAERVQAVIQLRW